VAGHLLVGDDLECAWLVSEVGVSRVPIDVYVHEVWCDQCMTDAGYVCDVYVFLEPDVQGVRSYQIEGCNQCP